MCLNSIKNHVFSHYPLLIIVEGLTVRIQNWFKTHTSARLSDNGRSRVAHPDEEYGYRYSGNRFDIMRFGYRGRLLCSVIESIKLFDISMA